MAEFDVKIDGVVAEFSQMVAIEQELKSQRDELIALKNNLSSFGKGTSTLKKRILNQAELIDTQARYVYKMKESLEDIIRTYMLKEALLTGDVAGIVAVFGDKIWDFITDASKEVRELFESWITNNKKEKDNILNQIRDDATRNGFSDAYRTTLQKVYDDVPTEYMDSRELYDKHIKKLKVGNFNSPNSYQSGDSIYVNTDKDLSNPRGSGTTYYHEYGHFIVQEEGWIKNRQATGQFKDFENSLKKEVGQYISSFEDTYRQEGINKGLSGNRLENYVETMTRSAIKSDIVGDDYSKLHINDGISDIIDGVSNDKYGVGYGHDDGYWAVNPSRLPNEAFAEIFSAQMMGDEAELSKMKEIFPESYKIFCEMVKEAK